MTDDKKPFPRRAFLKGAAACIVTAAPVSGLFITKAEAAKPTEMTRGSVKEPPGVKQDEDYAPVARGLMKSSLEGAYDAFNSANEAFVKGNANKLNTKSAMAHQGIQLRSPESKHTDKTFNVPPSVEKVRKQAKQKGWHIHASACIFSLCWHSHVSW